MVKRLLALAAICMLSLIVCSCGNSAKQPETVTENSFVETNVPSSDNDTSVESVEELTEEETVDEPLTVEANYTITRNIYGLVGDQIDNSDNQYSDFEFDERGNIISLSVSGSNIHTMSFEYDDNNRLTRALKETQLYGTEELICVYGENGTMIERHNIDTGKSGKIVQNDYIYELDSDGKYISGKHNTKSDNSGDTLRDLYFEYDELGRIAIENETINGETDRTITNSYEEGLYNPIQSTTERGDGSGYIEDYTYDDRGRLVNDHISYSSGKTIDFDFLYDIVGEITESPETNPTLIEGDKWEFFEDCPLLPTLDSCIETFSSTGTDKEYQAPAYKGVFVSAYGYPMYIDSILDISNAMTALDQYTAIISSVLGYEIQYMGNIIKISSDGQEIAKLNWEIVDSSFIITVIPA